MKIKIKSIVSDLDMEELMKVLGIKKILSTTYYSQLDRQTEQINQKVGIFLQHYVNY